MRESAAVSEATGRARSAVFKTAVWPLAPMTFRSSVSSAWAMLHGNRPAPRGASRLETFVRNPCHSDVPRLHSRITGRAVYMQMMLAGRHRRDGLCTHGWERAGVRRLDPTADIRLRAFCLSIPTERFLANGVDRLFARSAMKVFLVRPMRLRSWC